MAKNTTNLGFEHISTLDDIVDLESKILSQKEAFVTVKDELKLLGLDIKDAIEKVTHLKFSEHLNDVNENIEEFNYWLNKNNLFFSINNKNIKEHFIQFVNEFTEWNLCDSCGLIERTDELALVSSGDFMSDEYKAAVFACTKLKVDALCGTCMDSIIRRTKLDLHEVVQRIRENQMVYRVGDLVVLENVNFDEKKTSLKTYID